MSRYNRRMMHFLASVLLASMLVACSSPPTRQDTQTGRGGYYLDDGPPKSPRADLDRIPDAVPRDEPLHRFANRPYAVFGVDYTPQTERRPHVEEGLASWYGRRFHGRRTASGEAYDMYQMTAAHPTLPIPSYARVTALDTGRSVIVRINDRGPFHRNRVIDLSYVAAHRLGYIAAGSARVRVEAIDPATFDTAGERLESGNFVQVGAFARPGNAHALVNRLREALEFAPGRVRVVLKDNLHRVQVGPYADDAEAAPDRARISELLQLPTVMVRRD